jgi:hypothetical protein
VKGRDEATSSPPQEALGRSFYEKTWSWATTHPDIRILQANEIKHYSLAEFETAEQMKTGNSSVAAGNDTDHHSSPSVPDKVPPANSLLSLRGDLRTRLSAKGRETIGTSALPQQIAPSTSPSCHDGVERIAQRQPRRPAEHGYVEGAVFDEPSTTSAAPRLYASQGRIWQALTGHSMDLKKVPTMEFALLSIIAASSTTGITQPELTRLSGQDKRSVPHRTDELARKGYIIKKPVQHGRARTSLCVHAKFVSDEHFTASGAVDDVFQEGQFIASGFTILLYNSFKDAGVVPTREIRNRLVSAQTFP